MTNQLDYICDFCGRPCASQQGLAKHEFVCQTVPEDIREKGSKAVEIYIHQTRMKRYAMEHNLSGDGPPYICTLEGCGAKVNSPQGLGKHKSKCRQRSVAERQAFLPFVGKSARLNGKMYAARKRDRDTGWLEKLENGIGEHRTANGALWVEPKPVVQEVGKTELLISADTKRLGELLGRVFPELLSIFQFERLERK